MSVDYFQLIAFFGPAEQVRLMTCRSIDNYSDREFIHYSLAEKEEEDKVGIRLGKGFSSSHIWVAVGGVHQSQSNFSQCIKSARSIRADLQ